MPRDYRKIAEAGWKSYIYTHSLGFDSRPLADKEEWIQEEIERYKAKDKGIAERAKMYADNPELYKIH